MSPEARALIKLAAEIRRDVAAAGERLDGVRTRRADLAGGDPVLASFIALSLHSYYTAIETACERIARHIDGGVPTGDKSHQELLDAMSLELPGIRPRVIAEPTLGPLRELLGFRHFVRHAYAVAWRVGRLGELADLAMALHPALVADLDGFVAFLEALAHA